MHAHACTCTCSGMIHNAPSTHLAARTLSLQPWGHVWLGLQQVEAPWECRGGQCAIARVGRRSPPASLLANAVRGRIGTHAACSAVALVQAPTGRRPAVTGASAAKPGVTRQSGRSPTPRPPRPPRPWCPGSVAQAGCARRLCADVVCGVCEGGVRGCARYCG